MRADIFFSIQDILVQKSPTYVAIADLCGDFDLFWGEYWGIRIKIHIWGYKCGTKALFEAENEVKWNIIANFEDFPQCNFKDI